MICRSLAKAILFAVSLATGSHATSVTYDFYYHFVNPGPTRGGPFFGEFTAPDFIFNVTPPAGRIAQGSSQYNQILFPEDMASCEVCAAGVFQGLRITENSVTATTFYPSLGVVSTLYSITDIPASAFSQVGEFGFDRGNGSFMTVSQVGKAVTYAPEPASYVLVGSALLAAILQLRRKNA